MNCWLCLIIDRKTGKEVAEFVYNKRHTMSETSVRYSACADFEEQQKYQPNLRRYDDWYVDFCSI